MAIIRRIFILLLVILTLIGCKQKEESNYVPTDINITTYRNLVLDDKTYDYKTSLKLILIAGLDENELKGQTDFIGLFIFDREDNSYKFLNIPRELVVKTSLYDADGNYLSDTKSYINLIYSLNGENYQGAVKLVTTVSSLINEIPISNFLVTPLNSIENTLLVAEGLEYEIPNNSLEFLNPEWVKGTKVILNRDNIYKILRSRDINEPNTAFLRRERQNAFMELLAENKQVFDIDNLPLEEFLNNSSSNFTLNEYEDFYNMLSSYDFKGFVEFPGEYVEGDLYDEFYLNEYKNKIFIKELFYM